VYIWFWPTLLLYKDALHLYERLIVYIPLQGHSCSADVAPAHTAAAAIRVVVDGGGRQGRALLGHQLLVLLQGPKLRRHC